VQRSAKYGEPCAADTVDSLAELVKQNDCYDDVIVDYKADVYVSLESLDIVINIDAVTSSEVLIQHPMLSLF